MIVRLLYLVLLLLLAKYLLRALSEWLGESSRGRVAKGQPRTLDRGAMVKDPVCGLHLPQDRALSELRGGERVYFCSERCRDRYAEAGA